jgi:hypothetical protein
MPVKHGDLTFPNLSAISNPHIPRVLLNEPAGLLEVIASRLMKLDVELCSSHIPACLVCADPA